MGKKILIFVVTVFILSCNPIFAATKSSGNIYINMSYTLREKSDYIQGDPFLCVYLKNENKHYFVRLKYDGTKSKAVIKKPLVGKYKVRYFTAKAGKEKRCKNAVKLNAVPNKNIFQEIFPVCGADKYALYAGGTMNLNEGPQYLRISEVGDVYMRLRTTEMYDNVIPAYYIQVTGEKLWELQSEFHLYLYESNRYGSKVKKLQDVARKKNRYGYFRNMVITEPGHYYYLIEEKAPGQNLKADRNVLMDFNVEYAGERLCAKKVKIKRGSKVRTITIDTDSRKRMKIAVNDPDSKNAEYWLYGPILDTYPIEKANGTFGGKKTKMKKQGHTFSVTMSPKIRNDAEWSSYNIVKVVNGVVKKGYTINIPYRWSKYKNGQINTTWRVRPRVEFASVFKEK